jgi:hypothetical protein
MKNTTDEAFSGEHNLKVDFDFLIEDLFLEGEELGLWKTQNKTWNKFSASFSRDRYKHLLGKLQLKGEGSINLDFKINEINPNLQIPQESINDVGNLINLFKEAILRRSFLLQRDVCELLDLIESKIYPGILKKTFYELEQESTSSSLMFNKMSRVFKKKPAHLEKKLKEFEDLIKALLFKSRLANLNYMQEAFEKFEQIESFPNYALISRRKNLLDEYENISKGAEEVNLLFYNFSKKGDANFKNLDEFGLHFDQIYDVKRIPGDLATTTLYL